MLDKIRTYISWDSVASIVTKLRVGAKVDDYAAFKSRFRDRKSLLKR